MLSPILSRGGQTVVEIFKRFNSAKAKVSKEKRKKCIQSLVFKKECCNIKSSKY